MIHVIEEQQYFDTLLAGFIKRMQIIEALLYLKIDQENLLNLSKREVINWGRGKLTNPSLGNFRTITKVPKFHMFRVLEKKSGAEN